jgi:hypothetical protein
MRASSPRPGRLFAWIGLVLAILVGGYAYLGWAMSASFSVADPAQLPSYRTAGWVYLGLIGLSVVAALAAVVYLIRSRRSLASPPST